MIELKITNNVVIIAMSSTSIQIKNKPKKAPFHKKLNNITKRIK